MGSRIKIGSFPHLLDGERVLHFKNPLWFASAVSSPSYRLNFPLPPLVQQCLYITDRRMLFVGTFLGIITGEFDCWFDSGSNPPDGEIIKEVSWGRNFLGFEYLEIVSNNSRRFFLRSHQLRIKIYSKEAEQLHKIISDAILENEFWSS